MLPAPVEAPLHLGTTQHHRSVPAPAHGQTLGLQYLWSLLEAVELSRHLDLLGQYSLL